MRFARYFWRTIFPISLAGPLPGTNEKPAPAVVVDDWQDAIHENAPTAIARAGLKLCRLALESHLRRLAQQFRSLRRSQITQWRATLPPKVFGPRLGGLASEPETQFTERGIQDLAQKQSREAISSGPFTFPNDMQNNFLERGIAIVPMRAPTARTYVHLYVSVARRFLADLDDCAAKIGTTLQIMKAGVQHPHRLAIQRMELVAAESLVQPDRL